MMHFMSLPLWAIGFALLAVIVLAGVALARLGSRQAFGFFAQVAASLLLVGVGWLYLERLDAQDRAEQRRVIEARLSALTAQALLPNSNLACLEAEAGDAVSESCEKAIYGSPEQVAAALSYVGNRIDILRDIVLVGDSNDDGYARLRAPLARNIEKDRYGLVAQVLQARDNCSPDSCYLFSLVQRRDQLVTNMSERAYDAKVVRYAAGWGEKQPSGPALASQSQPAPTGKPVDMDFPSAASIPPISIMSNEPGRPGQNGMDSTTVKPEPRAAEAKAEQPRERAPAQQSQPKRAAAPKAAPKQQHAAPAPAAAPAADPFPQPISSAAQQTTGGAPTPISPQ